MNRGVLRSDRDSQLQGTSDVLWSTVGGCDTEPIAGTLNVTTPVGASVSWPASANTLTSWTEISSSSPYAVCALDIYMLGHWQSAGDTGLLFDIGTGSSGSETVLIDGIPLFGRTRFQHVRFPIRVAAGTRFAFRVQARTASGSLTSPQSPTCAIGFVRDIPEFPAGTSAVSVATVNRGTSVYPTISTVDNNQLANRWAVIGAVPTGKMIYAIPFSWEFSGNFGNGNGQLDYFGWVPDAGLSSNTQVAGPYEVFGAEIHGLVDSAENTFRVIPTIWIPNGYIGGTVVVASDCNNAITSMYNVFAVME